MKRLLQARVKSTLKSLSLIATLSTALTMAPAYAAVVGSDTDIDFTGGSTTFSFAGANFTLSDNMGDVGNTVSISTSANAAVRSFFGEPSVDFQTPIVYDGSFIQYASFPSTTVIRFSSTPSSLGLRVTLDDGEHYGYALFNGSQLQSYGFETTANLGIASGASISAVPEPGSYAMMVGGLLVAGAFARRQLSMAANT